MNAAEGGRGEGLVGWRQGAFQGPWREARAWEGHERCRGWRQGEGRACRDDVDVVRLWQAVNRPGSCHMADMG